MESTTVRLPDDVTRALDRLAERRQVTRSDIIRQAISEYCEIANRDGEQDRLALLDRLVTYSGSGRGDLATRSEEYLRAIFDERQRRRPR